MFLTCGVVSYMFNSLHLHPMILVLFGPDGYMCIAYFNFLIHKKSILYVQHIIFSPILYCMDTYRCDEMSHFSLVERGKFSSIHEFK